MIPTDWPLGTSWFLGTVHGFFSGRFRFVLTASRSLESLESLATFFCPAHKSEGEIRCVVVYTLYYNMVGVQYSKVAPFQEMLTEITKKAAYRCTTWWADVHGGSGCRVHNRRPKHRRQRRTFERKRLVSKLSSKLPTSAEAPTGERSQPRPPFAPLGSSGLY